MSKSPNKPVVDTHLNRTNWRTKDRKTKAKKNIKTGSLYQFTRLESFLSKEYASQLNEKRLKHHSKKAVPKVTENEELLTHKLYFVVRLGNSYGLSESIRKGLNALRILKVGTAIFLQATPTNVKILNRIKDFVMWGCPDSSQVQQLLQKRGHANIKGQLIPLSDNKFIEEQLGKNGIVCVEDIVHEITTVGTNFKRVQRWLAPFKIQAPKGGWNVQLGNGASPSHITEDQYGAPLEKKFVHNGYKTPEEMKKILQPII